MVGWEVRMQGHVGKQGVQTSVQKMMTMGVGLLHHPAHSRTLSAKERQMEAQKDLGQPGETVGRCLGPTAWAA